MLSKMNGLLNKLSSIYIQYGQYLAYGLMAAIPLKLSISYIFLFPLLILGWSNIIVERRFLSLIKAHQVISLFLTLFFVIFLALPFGINPLKSYQEFFFFLIYASSTIVFLNLLERVDVYKLISILIGAQCIAAAHSILEFSWPESFSRVFIGTVTESGQIALSLFLGLGLLVSKKLNSKKNILLVLAIFIIFIALVINLKRGPWAAVLVSGILFACLINYRYLLALGFFALLPLVFVSSLRQRIIESSNDFFVYGGRSEIWEIGLELAGRYPLGIGYGNSPFLREYSYKVPPELTHFHSNFLNILVETGFLGFAVYLCFLFVILKTLLQYGKSKILLAASGCALLASQIAGVVEYNMGDSEVMLIFYFTLALFVKEASTAKT